MTHRTFDDPTSIEARQHLLDNRCEHAPKRHRTSKRKSRQAAAKRAAGKHIAAMQLVVQRRRLASARAYWSGEKQELVSND
jgi:hypothetical protein